MLASSYTAFLDASIQNDTMSFLAAPFFFTSNFGIGIVKANLSDSFAHAYTYNDTSNYSFGALKFLNTSDKYLITALTGKTSSNNGKYKPMVIKINKDGKYNSASLLDTSGAYYKDFFSSFNNKNELLFTNVEDTVVDSLSQNNLIHKYSLKIRKQPSDGTSCFSLPVTLVEKDTTLYFGSLTDFGYSSLSIDNISFLSLAPFGSPNIFLTDTCRLFRPDTSSHIIEPSILLYPSITSTSVKINLNALTFKANHISIFSSIGQLVKSISLPNINSEINVSEFANGLYFVVFYSDAERTAAKFIKE